MSRLTALTCLVLALAFVLGCSHARHYRIRHDAESFYAVLHSNVANGDRFISTTNLIKASVKPMLTMTKLSKKADSTIKIIMQLVRMVRMKVSKRTRTDKVLVTTHKAKAAMTPNAAASVGVASPK